MKSARFLLNAVIPHLLFSVMISLFSLNTFAADLCLKGLIGKNLNFEIKQVDEKKVPKTFVIETCVSNIYSATEVVATGGSPSTQLKIKAAGGPLLSIEFMSIEKSDNFAAAVTGTWNTSSGEIAFDQCPKGESWDTGMSMCMPSKSAPTDKSKCGPDEVWDTGMSMCMPSKPASPPTSEPASPSTPAASTSSSSHQCPPGEEWDAGMSMCMPVATNASAVTKNSDPQKCPSGQHWDVGMHMCMPDTATGKTTVSFHYDQFIVYTDTSGARGRSAVTGPNMWMLMVNHKTSESNEVGLSWMGSTDLWTVGKKGTPQPLQVGDGFIDSQHPHSSPIMGLTFSDILTLGKDKKHKLTFFFAPRGEATAGPESFMHRASADGNPEVPLSHHLQDVFHVTSTVAGVSWTDGKTTVEGSFFSGFSPNPLSVKLDMHKPDSFAFRVNRQVTKSVTVGGSFANVNSTELIRKNTFDKDHQLAFSSWVTTNNFIKGGTLSTSSIWGAVKSRETKVTLNSFLEEYVYQLGKNGFFGRMEVLQRTPDQLDIVLVDGNTGARWVKSTTFGYERNVFSRDKFKLYVGGAGTRDYLPKDFQPAYGGSPWTGKAFLRITWGK